MTQYSSTSAPQETIDIATAQKQDEALIAVQWLLKERGVRARRDHTINLGLSADRPDAARWPHRPPVLRSRLTRRPPELVVHAPSGRRTVTVTAEPHGGYLVRLHTAPVPQMIGRQRPEKVVELILAAAPVMHRAWP
ncbi:hypothetical protein [Streptosporangium carneum]|uniref:hypothetical protein n=1 Tax=Streptosporangium carneum TaxID=47481 RepID=UPI0022F2D17B|nr:hypothetical protein [Streptosporangium carneum]